jgi:hypothetical protein
MHTTGSAGWKCTRSALRGLALAGLALAFASCGGGYGGGGSMSTTGALMITVQPKNASVPLGQTATFSVSAAGGYGTLTYQWLRNIFFIDWATK